MAKRVQMSGEQFTKLVRVMWGFKPRGAGATATEARDMFYLEVGVNADNAAIVTGYASDGYRAVRYDALLMAVDSPFKGFMRNPTFVPKATDTVTIELRGKALYVNYEAYGVTFATPQPADGQKNIRTLKKTMQSALSAAPEACVTVNNRHFVDAVNAVSAARTGSAQVEIAICGKDEPVRITSGDMQAIVYPVPELA